MRRRRRIRLLAGILLAGLLTWAVASRDSDLVPVQGQGAESAVSACGLFPIYGLDAGWASEVSDGSSYPSSQLVTAAFQTAWDSQFKSCGFNAVSVVLDVSDSQSPNRLANLLDWATAGNLRVAAILTSGQRGAAMDAGFSDKACQCVTAAVGLLKGANKQDSYKALLAYQLEFALNHPANRGDIAADSAAATLQAAAAAIRKAETASLEGTGLAGTPLAIGANVDVEMVKCGGIVGA